MAGMGEFLQRLEKAELHLHLEGSVEPETMAELDPSVSPEECLARYQYSSFAAFLKSYEWVTRRLRAPEDYALITRRLLERLARENVRYAEICLSAGVILWKKQDPAAVHEAVRAAALGSPVEVRWIWDAVRQFPLEDARRVAAMAAERIRDGVVAFGIGGDEARGPAPLFRDLFAWARRAGLHLTAHAGETTGPASIREALEIGAERIGHGIAAADDPALLEHLRDNRIPLEICLSSNLATGAVERIEDHPLRRLFEAGVPIVLNTDDPAMFRTSLTREFEIAQSVFGFTDAELAGIAANAFRYSFRGEPAGGAGS